MKFGFLEEPPFNFKKDDGSVSGCDVLLAKYVFEALDADRFEPIETEFANLLPGVARGDWRMTTGLFATPERQEIVAFSRPIWALPDGLLVAKGNPLDLLGYQSAADHADCILAVIRDQFQHRSAVEFGVPGARIRIFETYEDAANAVLCGDASAYASVARAHGGYIARDPALPLDITTIPISEKAPAYGAFAFAKTDDAFRTSVDAVLQAYLGSTAHRDMMAEFGFSKAEIDLIAT